MCKVEGKKGAVVLLPFRQEMLRAWTKKVTGMISLMMWLPFYVLNS